MKSSTGIFADFNDFNEEEIKFENEISEFEVD
jgi:hypothetical protein